MTSLGSAIGAFVAAHATAGVIVVFAAFLLSAAGFAAWPALRARGGGPLARGLLGSALAIFVVGVGGGAYLLVGSPGLARRALAPPEAAGVPGLIAELAHRLRDRPGDVTGWTLLGRGYLTLNDPTQAAVAFRHASDVASAGEKPELLSAYGEALTLSAGAVTQDAEDAFRAALAAKPKDFAARYYLGQAYAARRDIPRALALWQSLLADSPAHAPWRADLIDRMAALQAGTGGGPDIGAMVAGLASRLEQNPDDLSGWQRLVRAYVVLGKIDDARSALASAQVAMRGHARELAALDAEARSLKLAK